MRINTGGKLWLCISGLTVEKAGNGSSKKSESTTQTSESDFLNERKADWSCNGREIMLHKGATRLLRHITVFAEIWTDESVLHKSLAQTALQDTNYHTEQGHEPPES